jgi:UDP-3-O-[3-hydroxymyristoyl] glucosamine N-acyltransferase
MDFPRPYRLDELAKWLDCPFEGPADHSVRGANEIHRVRPGDLVFVDHPKYYDKALESPATTILINQQRKAPEGKGLLISEEPFADFNRLTRFFEPLPHFHQSIAPEAEIGEGCTLGPGAVIGPLVKMGENCRIGPNVVLRGPVTLGNEVVIQAGSILGADAFYYKKHPQGFDPLHSAGGVIVEDRVHLGASVTIDRGVSDYTIIGANSILDNLVQIGHDTRIGQRCLFAAQVGVAGCVDIEDEVTLWGQVGVASGLTIGRGAVVMAQSGISKSLKGGVTYFGYPAGEARSKYRELAAIRKLPEIIEQL